MRKTVLLSLVAVLCVCLFGLVACNKVEAESVDYNNVALNGLTEVTIDKTETFDILDGVTAVYKYSDGTEKDLTSEIRYVLPAQANFVGAGYSIVTFNECGDYEIPYYISDGNGNHTVELRLVQVCNLNDVVDYNQIELNGIDEVMIDRATETFDVMSGVSAEYELPDGTEKDLSDEVRYILPAQANADGNIVTFKECGDFEIPYYISDGKGNHTVAFRLVKVRNIYNCYWVNATIPVLYCALDMVSNDYKSMLVFTRADTLNIDELDEGRFIYKANGADVNELDASKKYMAHIASTDKWSYFRAFICDAFNQIELFSFVQNGIPTSRYEVKLVSDGSWTYTKAFPYRDAGSYDKWKENKRIYDGIYNQALKNEFEYVNTISNTKMYRLTFDGVEVGSHYYNDVQLSQMTIMAAQRDNVEMWCGYPETLTSADPKVQAEIDKAHMPKMSPDVMYADFSEEQKEKFLKICNLVKDTFDTEYFNQEGDYLIITGTNPFAGSFTDAEFADILQRIVDDYSGYNILYKPHPSALAPTDNMPMTKGVLEANNIKIMPGRLPMEVITWVYPNVRLGGFDSSLFMAIPQGNTEFFIANGPTSLSVLTKQLYDSGAFGTPKFYWKNNI